MRKIILPISVALALIYGAGGLAAQGPERVASESFQIPAPVLPVGPVATEAPSLQNRILSGIAAAVLGAGIGYFASQVATGDWEKGAGQGGIHRPTWAAVGGAGGLVLGFSMPLGGKGSGPVTPFPFEDERLTITGEEVRKAMVVTAMEAVRFFHPEWLVIRGPETFESSNTDYVKAYLDNRPLGNVEALEGIETSLIESIRFFDSRKATARWGMSHPHGAIQVVTLGGGSSR